MKEIQLTQGKVALVDDEDYEWLARWKWHAQQRSSGIWYACRTIKGTVYMHRIILKPPHDMVVDHVDGDGLNNQRSNMRVCNHGENIRNQKGHHDKRSRYKGLHWNERNAKWRAELHIEHRKISLGLYDSEEDAARAYNEAAIKYHGEFARLNIL